jgi:hypothetical protein
MKYLIATILSVLAFNATAQHRPYYHHGHSGGYGWNWVAPAIIGGAIVYGATRPTAPAIVYQQQALPPAPYGFHYEQILDANCNCYRWVLIQG